MLGVSRIVLLTPFEIFKNGIFKKNNDSADWKPPARTISEMNPFPIK